MRQKNPRLVITGSVLFVLAVAFFFVMLSIASKSTDPAALMQIVGTVSGVLCGLSVAMMLIGHIGRKV